MNQFHIESSWIINLIMLFTLSLHENGQCWTLKIIIIKSFSFNQCCEFNEEETNYYFTLNICLVHNWKYLSASTSKRFNLLRSDAQFSKKKKKININSWKRGLYFGLILNSWKGTEYSKSSIFLFVLVNKSMCQGYREWIKCNVHQGYF